jgi:glycerol-3-phosphate acyltransferase PlsY
MGYIVTMPLAYLLGSIPFGFLAAKAKGIDIRKEGSGNIGATNVLRVLGKPAGITVLVFDGLKGFAAAAWLVDLTQHLFALPFAHLEILRLSAGLCAVLGHNYTCWLKFKGGKGIATTAGVLAALVPLTLVIIISLFLVLILATRFVSVGSIGAALALPLVCWLTGSSLALILVTGALSILALYKHRSNIRRLMNGTESRIGSHRKEATS